MSPEWGRVSQAEIDAAVTVETAARAAAVTAEATARDLAIAVHTAVINAHLYTVGQKIKTGKYFAPWPVASGSTRALTADRLTAHPFLVERALTIDRLAIVVATFAGTVARLGIYADGTNCYPGALVKDAGTVATTGNGLIATTLSPALSLTKGLYWLVVVGDGTPTVTAAYFICNPIGYDGIDFQLADTGNCWYKNAVGSGALADPFVSGASALEGAQPLIVPRLLTLD